MASAKTADAHLPSLRPIATAFTQISVATTTIAADATSNAIWAPTVKPVSVSPVLPPNARVHRSIRERTETTVAVAISRAAKTSTARMEFAKTA